ncbi:glycosyltransferase family 1 protein [Rhizobium sp. L51/94]|uniref:glycosyltransferase family 4 protein n=1 Tax=Rhizobium sp. L51/94 TaxID=2819999 RepID=UPI001C5B1F58|nr:glycosyltransferase family 1 protein [Rhizobium sp. L51/94]QXZ80902.1 glycosyltransferase family 4 protein [Rhizobium sp. L51/94]
MRIGVDARNLVTSITGISRYVLESCRALSEMGHDLILYLPERQPSNLQLPGRVNAALAYRGGLLRTVWGQTRLPILAQRDDLDIFWGPAHRLPTMLSSKLQAVVTIHDLVWRDASSTMTLQGWLADMSLMGPAISRASRVVAVSNATAVSLEMAYPNSKQKTRVVYPGLTVFPEHLALPSEYLDIQRPYMLFVGTLEPRKNLAKLLQAYAQLPGTIRRQLSLVIAGGPGWKVDHLADLARLGIADSVRIVGYVTDAQLAGLYRDAEFLVMVSLYEGFGLPIIEANSMGTPTIVSSTSSLPEVAGKAAILVDPNNVDEISNAITSLWSDRDLHARLSANALSNAARFSWKNTATGLISVFEDALSNSCNSA